MDFVPAASFAFVLAYAPKSSKKRAKANQVALIPPRWIRPRSDAYWATSSIEVIFQPPRPVEITRSRRIERPRVCFDPSVRLQKTG